MSPTVGALIALTFMLINFSLGLAFLYKTVKAKKQH